MIPGRNFRRFVRDSIPRGFVQRAQVDGVQRLYDVRVVPSFKTSQQ